MEKEKLKKVFQKEWDKAEKGRKNQAVFMNQLVALVDGYRGRLTIPEMMGSLAFIQIRLAETTQKEMKEYEITEEQPMEVPDYVM